MCVRVRVSVAGCQEDDRAPKYNYIRRGGDGVEAKPKS